MRDTDFRWNIEMAKTVEIIDMDLYNKKFIITLLKA